MAISFVYPGAKVTTYDAAGKPTTDDMAKGYFNAEDYDKMPKDKPHGTFATCIDWEDATSEQKAKMVDPVQVFDAKAKKWRPFLP